MLLFDQERERRLGVFLVESEQVRAALVDNHRNRPSVQKGIQYRKRIKKKKVKNALLIDYLS